MKDTKGTKEMPGPIEFIIEWLIVRSRWLMAPFYIGLIAGLAVLLVKFFSSSFTIRS